MQVIQVIHVIAQIVQVNQVIQIIQVIQVIQVITQIVQVNQVIQIIQVFHSSTITSLGLLGSSYPRLFFGWHLMCLVMSKKNKQGLSFFPEVQLLSKW